MAKEEDHPELIARITRVELGLDPTIDVFNVVLKTKTGVWHHTAGGEHDLETFLEGVRAGCGVMQGFFSPPAIPRNPSVRINVPEQVETD